MKIAIGDVADPQYDSGVFLEAGSFNSRRDEAQPRFKEYADLSSKMNFDSIFGQSRPALISKKDSIANEEYEYFQLTNVNFESDSYSIPDTSRDELLKLADYLHRNKQFNCSFYGYTDNVGSKKYNQRLSENRANAVMDFLVSKGVVRERMSIAGYNFENPIADNSNEFGRAMNRRVEIVLIEE
jgi:outer membrane protein OmpA-like peptidoglycan-associated protein